MFFSGCKLVAQTKGVSMDRDNKSQELVLREYNIVDSTKFCLYETYQRVTTRVPNDVTGRHTCRANPIRIK